MVRDGSNLIPIKIAYPDTYKEMAAQGGRVKSKRKRDASFIRNSKVAKCKNCKLKCEFREMCLKVDPEATCAVPAMRGEARINQTGIVNLNDEKVKMYMDELISLYRVACLETPSNETQPRKVEREKMRRLNTFFHRVKEFKEVWYPPVKKNVNLNLNTNFDKMVERIKAHKEKEGEIIIIEDEE